MNKKNKVLIGVLSIIIIALAGLYFGMKVSPITWRLLGPINENSSLALKGYDPVAYFNEGKAIKGDTTNGIRWGNVIWYFSSDANKLMFKTFPDKYIPQFGGYCAVAVSSGFTADIDPEAWHIDKGKLYLFFDQSAKNSFIDEIDNGIVEKATSEWVKR